MEFASVKKKKRPYSTLIEDGDLPDDLEEICIDGNSEIRNIDESETTTEIKTWVRPKSCSWILHFLWPAFMYGVVLYEIVYISASWSLVGKGSLIGSLSLIYILFIISFLRTRYTDPGSVPAQWKNIETIQSKITREQEQNFLEFLKNPYISQLQLEKSMENFRGIYVIERKKKNFGYRRCSSCKTYKPDRAHHCKHCNRCTLKMDHHCHSFSTCIGLYNYKFMLLTYFYLELLCIISLVVTAIFGGFFFPCGILNTGKIVGIVAWALVGAFCFVHSITNSIFLRKQIVLLMNNRTTLEQKEKFNSGEPLLLHHARVANLKYNLDWYNNVCSVLGSPYMWLLPCARNIRPNSLSTHQSQLDHSPPSASSLMLSPNFQFDA